MLGVSLCGGCFRFCMYLFRCLCFTFFFIGVLFEVVGLLLLWFRLRLASLYVCVQCLLLCLFVFCCWWVCYVFGFVFLTLRWVRLLGKVGLCICLFWLEWVFELLVVGCGCWFFDIKMGMVVGEGWVVYWFVLIEMGCELLVVCCGCWFYYFGFSLF